MTNNGGGGSGGMTMNLTGGQVISSSPGAYIMDNAAPHPATQTARASPATVSAPPPSPHRRRNGADHLHPPACFCVLPPFRLVPRLGFDLRPQPPGVVSIDATFLVPSSLRIFERARVLVHTFADFIGALVTPVFWRIYNISSRHQAKSFAALPAL